MMMVMRASVATVGSARAPNAARPSGGARGRGAGKTAPRGPPPPAGGGGGANARAGAEPTVAVKRS